MDKIKILLIGCCLVLLVSCTYDSETDLIVIEDLNNDDSDEIDSNITYENTIKAIVDSNCISCHADPPRNGAPFSLVNFSQVSARANGILNAISRQSGAPGAMPPAGRLPQNTINVFEEWIANEAPED